MGALKGLVVVMGILIVVAMGALAYGLYHKAGNPEFRLFAGGDGKPAGFGTVRLEMPAGCGIAASEVSDGRLFVRFGRTGAVGDPAPACDRIIVLDVANGATLGIVSAGSAP